MDKKLGIIVCPTGALITREQNPHQPYTAEEVAAEAIDALREGACMVHLHCRHEDGLPDYRPETLRRALDKIFQECPDVISGPSISANPSEGTWLYEVETIRPFVEALKGYGFRYMESTVVTPISYVSQRASQTGGRVYIRRATEENLQAEVKYLQSKGVRPEFMGHDTVAVEQVKEWLIKPGVLEKPYFITLGPGMHHAAPTYPDPWGLLHLISMRYLMPEDAIVGASIGGRNWLPLAVLSIILGADFIRVGKEDTMWMYPHRDDHIRTNADVVRKIASVAKELGRDIMSPNEARKKLALPPP